MNEFIFIACAMRREAYPFIDKMEDVKDIDLFGYKIYKGTINTKDIIVGISGPGLINMSSLVSLVLSNYNISYVINYGMVGGYGSVRKLDLVIGSECINTNSYMTSHLDEGIDINGWDLVTFTDGGNDELVVYNSDKTLIDLCKEIKYDKNIHYGRVGSGDIWLNELERINLLMNKYQVICEDMEAVAVYQISNKFNKKCISIKGVSDNKYLNEGYDDSVIPLLVEYVFNYVNQI